MQSVAYPSHACKQVAAGRWNPISPAASYDPNFATSDTIAPLPGAHAEGSDGLRFAKQTIRATRVSKWLLDA
jgi:hypothetical protein